MIHWVHSQSDFLIMNGFKKNMNTYSLQSSLEERARKKSPTLDIAAPKKVLGAVSPVPLRFVVPAAAPPTRRLDGIKHNRSFLALYEQSWQDVCKRLLRKGQLYMRRVKRLIGRVMPTLAPHKMLYASIFSGIAFGMVSMAFIEHAFGPGVFARSEMQATASLLQEPGEKAISATSTDTEEYTPDQDVFFEYFGQVTKEKYEENIREMVKGYPIEAMLPYIFEQDRLTAAFLIGIAKKESNWGKRIPVLDNQDCFNYWGYRGVRRMMGTGGHTCFNSRKDAVETVATRLNRLIHSEKLDTPEKMIVWKCGFSCQGHSRESVKKWISDVDMYFSQLSDE